MPDARGLIIIALENHPPFITIFMDGIPTIKNWWLIIAIPRPFHLSSIVPTCWAAAASPWAPPWCPAPRRPLSLALAPWGRGGGAAGPPCGGGGGAGRYDGWMENHRKPLENGDFSWYLMAKLRKNLGKPMGKWENHRKTKGKWWCTVIYSLVRLHN